MIVKDLLIVRDLLSRSHTSMIFIILSNNSCLKNCAEYGDALPPDQP